MKEGTIITKKDLEDEPDIPELLDIRDDLRGYVTHAKTPNKADLKMLGQPGLNIRYDPIEDENEKPKLGQQDDEALLKSMGIAWESRWLNHKKLVEGLTYKEFRNASKAVSKICPSCGNNFKTVHDANQVFCSLPCEEDGGLTEKLKEAFDRFN